MTETPETREAAATLLADNDQVLSRLYAWLDSGAIVPPLNAYEAVLDALADAWRPIESAPKDGTYFMGFIQHTTGGATRTCVVSAPENPEWEFSYWRAATGVEPPIEETHQKVDGCDEGFWRLTHWMPLPPPPAEDGEKPRSSAAQDILAERKRQIEQEGWTPEHDDEHSNGSMANAAAAYAHVSSLSDALLDSVRDEPVEVGLKQIVCLRRLWPWAKAWWKPKDRRHNLVRAGALIIAEIERLDRLSASTPAEDGGG